MANQSTSITTFGGERGTLASWRDPNLFSANNIFVQVDGAITSRPAFKSPWTWDWDGTTMSGQTIWGMGVGAGTDTEEFPTLEHIWILLGQTLFAWDGINNSPPIQVGTLDAVPTKHCTSVRQGNTVWIASPDEGLYRYTVTTGGTTLTKVSNVVPGTAFAVWQGLELTSGATSGLTSGTHRLYWSDSEGVWPASTNFNDIGDEGSAITGIYVLRNQLMVSKDDGSWWMVTGQLATTELVDAAYSVRDAQRTNYPVTQQRSGFVNENIIAFSPNVGGFPVTYNGSQFSELRYLADADMKAADVIGGAGIGDLLYHKGEKGLLYQNQVWVKFDTPMSEAVVLYPRPNDEQTFVFITAPDDETETSPRLHLLPADPMTSPDLTTSLDIVHSTITFAEFSFDVLVKARAVHIDYRRIATDGQQAGFFCTVNPVRYPKQTGLNALPVPVAITRATNLSENEPETPHIAGRFRETVNVGNMPDAFGFEVILDDILCIAVEKITIEYAVTGKTDI